MRIGFIFVLRLLLFPSRGGTRPALRFEYKLTKLTRFFGSDNLPTSLTIFEAPNKYFMSGKVKHTYIHAYIIVISSFQNGLNNPCCSTGFYFKAKLWKVVMKSTNVFELFLPFSQNVPF